VFPVNPSPSRNRSGSAMKFPSVLRVAGLACVLISCALLLSCGTKGTPETSVTGKLAQITIAPANKSIPTGSTLQLSATGVFSDGTQQDVTSSVTWEVTPSTVASIDAQGDLDGLGAGVAQVSATYQGIVGNTSTTIGLPALVQIALHSKLSSLPVGESESVTATGTFSDGSTQNLTDSVTWKSSPLTVASITAQGDLKALTQGTAQISATSAGVTGDASITVGPPALLQIALSSHRSSLPVGESELLTATGSFSDGSTQNLNNSVTWVVSPSKVASINAQGDLKALAQGVAQVSATYQGLAGSTSITVGQAALLQIAVASAQPSLPVGESELLTATGSFSDGSSQNLTDSVTWSVSPSKVASINAQGDLKALTPGAAQVSAAYQGITGSTSITVGQVALLQIALSPNSSSLPQGESEAMTATGLFSDGSQQNLTPSVAWSSAAPAIATVSTTGNATGESLGSTTIGASLGPVRGTASLTVTAPVIIGLNLTPATSSLIIGSTGSLQAIATLSDGTTQNLTRTATWRSSQPAIVGVSSAGVLTAQQVGSATIQAQSNSFNASASLTVTPLMTVSYFNRVNSIASGVDGTVELANPGFTAGNLCAMVYVFDQQQELNECCGCTISYNGMRTFSLLTDLTGNPLTGKEPLAGTIEIVPANPGQNGVCDPGSSSPNSMLPGWATNVQGAAGAYQVTEIPLATVPLAATQAQVLAGECSILEQLGEGKGVCSCGSGN
jgi:trimeric autotransporter adhesin